MKKLILFLVIAVISFQAYEHNAEKKRQSLTGKWMMERKIEGGWVRLILNLKPEGDVLITGDGSLNGRLGYAQCSGDWKLRSNSLVVNFKRSDVPFYKPGKEYGGQILALDEKTLSYKSDDGTETWSRFN